jgi:hypothetical protein
MWPISIRRDFAVAFIGVVVLNSILHPKYLTGVYRPLDQRTWFTYRFSEDSKPITKS